MTRRERMENRAARRREWADGRSAKAAAGFRVGDEHRDEHGRMDWALVTQPGHIPERARINRAHDRAIEHAGMAQYHEAKAAGIEHQLATSIFSDDDNAAQACDAKADGIEAEAEMGKSLNAAYRKAPGDPAAKLAHLVEKGILTREEAMRIATEFARCPWQKQPVPSYHLTNLRANARRYRQRAADIQQRARLQAAAEAAPNGVVITRHTDYDVCTVRFAEKPEREILDALRAAGFMWGAGAWSGAASRLPAEVAALEGEVAR